MTLAAVGDTIRHPDFDSATVVGHFKSSCGDPCYVIHWRGEVRRITADSCKPERPKPVGGCPSGRPEGSTKPFESMRPGRDRRLRVPRKPNGKCGAHSPYPLSLYEIALRAGRSREAVGQYVRRHGYDAALAFYGGKP